MKTVLLKILGYGNEFTLQHRIFNATSFAAIIINIITALINYYLNLKPFTYLFPFFSSFLFVGFYLYSIHIKNFYLISRVTFIYLLFFFVPIYWFLNGGSQGGFQYFTIFFLIILVTTIPGKKRVFIIGYLLMLLAILCLEYFYPNLVIGYSTRKDRYIDVIVSYTILSIIILIVLNIYVKLYEHANKTLSKQKKDIQTAHKELKATNEELNDVNRTKDKFFAIISHDLRSPLGTMLGFFDVLNTNYDKYDKKEQKKYLDIIHQSAKTSFKLLENLLFWSRSQQGSIAFKPQKINLYLLVHEICALLRQPVNSKLIKLTNQLHPNIYIYADKDMLSTIIRNLIFNAIKFTPKGGEISIEAEDFEDENNHEFIKISVKDSGVGIKKEIQAKLFDIAEHISTKGTENENGTGLGLLLCKEFIDKHGGTIKVESEYGKGSEFVFFIPKKENVN